MGNVLSNENILFYLRNELYLFTINNLLQNEKNLYKFSAFIFKWICNEKYDRKFHFN